MAKLCGGLHQEGALSAQPIAPEKEMTPEQALMQISHRVSEINTWIMVRNLVWVALLITSVWLCLQASTLRAWLLVGFISVSWLFFEASAAYYIHTSGAQTRRLEQHLSEPAEAHEHQRAVATNPAGKVAGFGFFVPFLLPFLGACYMLCTQCRQDSGLTATTGLVCGLIVAAIFYATMMHAARAS